MALYPETDIHMHTSASSHAFSTIHDYINEAQRKRLKLFAITDHGPEMEDAPHEWHFQNSVIFPRIVNNVGILRGIEANIKNLEGDIDCSEKVAKSLDIILCGFHRQVFAPRSSKENTLAMVNTIATGRVDIITHPGNPKFPIDPETIVRAAKKYNVALEINNSSFLHSRRGSEITCSEIIQLAKEYDAPLSIGSDAHIAFDIGRVEKSLEMLDKNGYPIASVINMTAKSLLEYLDSRGKPLWREFSSII